MTMRLRLLRKQSGLTLEALARRAGLNTSYLSKIERGRSVPSISTAIKLAGALGVDVEQLFGDSEQTDLVTVVRADERTPLSDGRTPAGSPYEGLATNVVGKQMLPFVTYPPIGDAQPPFREHTGEELVFVLSGRIELQFPGRVIELDAGDSAYFQGAIPHIARTISEEQASMLVVISAVPGEEAPPRHG